jgi:hypothetical protein
MRKGVGPGTAAASGRGCSVIALFLWVVLCGWLLVLYKYKPSSPVSTSPAVGSPIVPTIRTVFHPPAIISLDSTTKTTGSLISSPPSLPPTQSSSALTASTAEDSEGIHVAFSTDCSFFQDWQTILVFHSAGVVGQKGPITRIASGCNEAKQAELKALYSKLYPQYHVHFTPDFKTDGKTKKKYDFYNKPFGVEHWLDNADPPIKDGVVIAIIDPDFIFLRPLTVDVMSGANSIPYSGNREQIPENEAFMKQAGLVRKGHPAAQRYGLGAPWATPNKNFNRTEVCGANSPCLDVHHRFGEVHYRYTAVALSTLISHRFVPSQCRASVHVREERYVEADEELD